MDAQLLNFFKSIDSTTSNVRWKNSGPDLDFFNICADKLNDLRVKTILDICCGNGDFINICTEKYGMKSYGIDPLITTNYNLYNGTIDSVLKNQNLLNDFKFDCISIQNTLHGKYWQDNELISILQFLKKFSKYIVITDPINNPDINLIGVTKIHSFAGSHGSNSAMHHIYEVKTK
tara:strand:- start:3758 stop:4285 length:528 start_codon:yes stop_codon:yes gene_type:complete